MKLTRSCVPNWRLKIMSEDKDFMLTDDMELDEIEEFLDQP